MQEQESVNVLWRKNMCKCYECESTNNLEDHHMVYRNQQYQMSGIGINKIKLCAMHHRGINGPHKCMETDRKYKLLFQQRLYQVFENDYYDQEQIRKLLHTNSKLVVRLTKNLHLYKEGYLKQDIISACMGGKIYSIDIQIADTGIEQTKAGFAEYGTPC
jgi:hypothetical protein